MVSVIILNSANGFYQNSLYGIVGSFPPKYINAIVLGNNICGLLITLLLIITTLSKYCSVSKSNKSIVCRLQRCPAMECCCVFQRCFDCSDPLHCLRVLPSTKSLLCLSNCYWEASFQATSYLLTFWLRKHLPRILVASPQCMGCLFRDSLLIPIFPSRYQTVSGYTEWSREFWFLY